MYALGHTAFSIFYSILRCSWNILDDIFNMNFIIGINSGIELFSYCLIQLRSNLLINPDLWWPKCTTHKYVRNVCLHTYIGLLLLLLLFSFGHIAHTTAQHCSVLSFQCWYKLGLWSWIYDFALSPMIVYILLLLLFCCHFCFWCCFSCSFHTQIFFLNFNSYLQCVCLWFSCLLAIFVWISMGRQRMRVTDLMWVVENACKMCTFVEFQMEWNDDVDKIQRFAWNIKSKCAIVLQLYGRVRKRDKERLYWLKSTPQQWNDLHETKLQFRVQKRANGAIKYKVEWNICCNRCCCKTYNQ